MRRPCCDREKTKKGAWSEQEDQKLINHIQTHGEGNWNSLPHAAGLLRCGKSCRLRWLNYLRPDLKRGNFGEDEEDLIIKLHALLGNRWSLIAGRLPGRSDNEVKNYWNSHLRRKLVKAGTIPPHRKPSFSGRKKTDCRQSGGIRLSTQHDDKKVRAAAAAVSVEQKEVISLDKEDDEGHSLTTLLLFK